MATMMSKYDLADHYRAEYPQTSLTRNAIVRLLLGGCVPVVQAGSRKFYSYEAFLAFLEQGSGQSAEPLDSISQIRRIG